jgi:hypothetical protein
MQVIRQEQLAKAKGFGMIGLMLLVAAAVHYWPGGERAGLAPRVEFATADAGTPAAAPVPAPTLAGRELRFRRVDPPLRRVRPPAPRTVVSQPKPVFKPEALPMETLSGLPGTPSHLPRPAGFVPTLAPPLAPAPAVTVETRPVPAAQRSGALAVAAKTTGKGIAVAFQKTGAAFRRVF